MVTLDSRRRILKDGAIAVSGDTIVAVGKSKDLEAEYRDYESLDAQGAVAMPGFINGHFHSNQQLSRGLADNVFLPTFIHERIYPFESQMTEEDIYLSALCACIEAIKSGTTCFADPGGYHMERVVKAVTESGIRAVLSRSMIDIHTSGRPIPGRLRESTDKAIESGEGFVKTYHGAAEGRVRAWFSLRTERMVSNDLVSITNKKAEEYGVGVQTHVSGNPDSLNRHKEIFQTTPLLRYHKAGLLGPNLLIVHANHLTDEELKLVEEYDVKIVYCPTAAFMGGYGGLLSKHVESLRKGVCVCLGSDAACESNFNDMFRVMYSLTAHRDYRLDATLFPPEELLEIVIKNGAKALLWGDEIGSLEKGYKADLILLDSDRPEWLPAFNPVSGIVHSATGDSVKTVVINGKIVMKDRKLTLLPEEEILRKGRKAAREILARAGLESFALPRWPIE